MQSFSKQGALLLSTLVSWHAWISRFCHAKSEFSNFIVLSTFACDFNDVSFGTFTSTFVMRPKRGNENVIRLIILMDVYPLEFLLVEAEDGRLVKLSVFVICYPFIILPAADYTSKEVCGPSI